jgi:EF-hand domain-containing protein 1
MPLDAYQESRIRPSKNVSSTTEKRDKLKRFLENDRKVLRFYCVWDDRHSMFGEIREFVIDLLIKILHYHLVDDTIEVREVQKPNNGRDPTPILLRRQLLPKVFHELSDIVENEKYTWKDLKIGATINLLGRAILMY